MKDDQYTVTNNYEGGAWALVESLKAEHEVIANCIKNGHISGRVAAEKRAEMLINAIIEATKEQ